MTLPLIVPPPLRPGSHIAIASPSGAVDPAMVAGACKVLRRRGWVPVVMPNALARYGSFAGTDEQRLDDMTRALTSPQFDAVLCSRGGYGAVRLLPMLDKLPLRLSPRWIIGYSDITALHCLMGRHGIASLHAPNCRHLALNRGDDASSQRLFHILDGHAPAPVTIPSHPLSVSGQARGVLRGGNLAVLAGLISTPFDNITASTDTILVVEDIAEPIYKVERIFHTLLLNGTLSRLRGIVFGQFTSYRPTALHATMEQMLRPIVAGLGIPVAFGFPAGHVDINHPLILSAPASLEVEGRFSTLKMLT